MLLHLGRINMVFLIMNGRSNDVVGYGCKEPASSGAADIKKDTIPVHGTGAVIGGTRHSAISSSVNRNIMVSVSCSLRFVRIVEVDLGIEMLTRFEHGDSMLHT